jgi:threonine dehydratase
MISISDAVVGGYPRVLSAAARLKGISVVTPLLNSRVLDDLLGVSLYLKAESLQHTGSFKFRGAFNKMSLVSEAERLKGFVAPSSGNHGQAVALAAKLFKVPAIVLMPSDAPLVKVAGTRNHGADVRFYERETDDRIRMAFDIAAETCACFISSSDDLDIIAGQGTVALEFLDQLRAADASNLPLDAVFASCCGGGLVAGISDVCEVLSPQTLIYAVEPIGFDDMKRSLESGQTHCNERTTGGGSICDSLLSPSPGLLPLKALRRRGNMIQGAVVSEDDVKDAMRIAYEYFNLKLEPGGAAALAAVLTKKCDLKGKRVVVIASGGNIDSDRFESIVVSRRPPLPLSSNYGSGVDDTEHDAGFDGAKETCCT